MYLYKYQHCWGLTFNDYRGNRAKPITPLCSRSLLSQLKPVVLDQPVLRRFLRVGWPKCERISDSQFHRALLVSTEWCTRVIRPSLRRRVDVVADGVEVYRLPP